MCFDLVFFFVLFFVFFLFFFFFVGGSKCLFGLKKSRPNRSMFVLLFFDFACCFCSSVTPAKGNKKDWSTGRFDEWSG